MSALGKCSPYLVAMHSPLKRKGMYNGYVILRYGLEYPILEIYQLCRSFQEVLSQRKTILDSKEVALRFTYI